MSKTHQSTPYLKPVDAFVFEGFANRVQQQFSCPVFYCTSSAERTQILDRLRSKELSYPYLTITPTSFSESTESYSANLISRRGLVALVDEDTKKVRKVRLLPQLIEVDIEYRTLDFQGSNNTDVMFFIRRWKFARRNGALCFTINYGALAINIQVRGSEQIPFTPRDSPLEGLTEYVVTTQATIHGYLSEPELGEAGVVDTVAQVESVGQPEVRSPTEQFFPF